MSWNPQGDSKRYATDCGASMAYHQRYPVKLAAALWCDVPPDEIQWVLATATEIGRGIFAHPSITCLEPKCRALHEAIEAGQLPVYREQGGAVADHVAPERRHVSRHELRAWIVEHYPSQMSPTLFDEIERTAHPAIKSDAFHALQADRDAARAELEKAEKWGYEILAELDALRSERDQLRAIVEKANEPGERAHVSSELAALNRAAHRFWEYADPEDRGTHPENKEVIAWLIDNGFTKTRAAKAASIIRPEWAPVGRKPDE